MLSMQIFEKKDISSELGFRNNFDEIKNNVIDKGLDKLENPKITIEDYNNKLEKLKTLKGWEVLSMDEYTEIKKYNSELFDSMLSVHNQILDFVLSKNDPKEQEAILKSFKKLKKDQFYEYNFDSMILLYKKGFKKDADDMWAQMVLSNTIFMNILENKEFWKD